MFWTHKDFYLTGDDTDQAICQDRVTDQPEQDRAAYQGMGLKATDRLKLRAFRFGDRYQGTVHTDQYTSLRQETPLHAFPKKPLPAGDVPPIPPPTQLSRNQGQAR